MSFGKTKLCCHQMINDIDKTRLLKDSHIIAIVGLSPKTHRPSHRVAKFLQMFSYQIVPVRPAVTHVLGEKAYNCLTDIPFKVDLVNVFRASQYAPEIVDECIQCNMPALWLQEGISHERAALKAQQAGIKVVMNACVYKEIVRLRINQPAGSQPALQNQLRS